MPNSLEIPGSAPEGETERPASRHAVRRNRRPTAHIRELILAAARRAFAERGFAGTTTRQIAVLADVAEPLIFNNFGTKAALFAEAVIEPFNARIGDFLGLNDGQPPDRELRSGRFVHALYPFLRENADLLMAMVKSTGEMEPSVMSGLDIYFNSAVERMREQYRAAGLEFDVAPDLVVRYAFGMVAGAVLFGDWFFADDKPDEASAEAALARMVFKASEPVRDERPWSGRP